jgi:hypothetical protein
MTRLSGTWESRINEPSTIQAYRTKNRVHRRRFLPLGHHGCFGEEVRVLKRLRVKVCASVAAD